MNAIYVGYEATVSGYGWVNATIDYEFSGGIEGDGVITQIEVGTLGVTNGPIGVTPDGKKAENVNISRSIHAATASETYGDYTWNVTEDSFVSLQPVAPKWRYNIGLNGGGSWVWEAWGDGDTDNFSGSGSWTMTGKHACPKCSQVGYPILPTTNT